MRRSPTSPSSSTSSTNWRGRGRGGVPSRKSAGKCARPCCIMREEDGGKRSLPHIQEALKWTAKRPARRKSSPTATWAASQAASATITWARTPTQTGVPATCAPGATSRCTTTAGAGTTAPDATRTVQQDQAHPQPGKRGLAGNRLMGLPVALQRIEDLAPNVQHRPPTAKEGTGFQPAPSSYERRESRSPSEPACIPCA